MHAETLPGTTRNTLEQIGVSGVLRDAYLAGGTAIALQLGHRISYDLDFFTVKDFAAAALERDLQSLGFVSEQLDQWTLYGTLRDVKFSCFRYPYPLLAEPIPYLGISVASLDDLLPMKLEAIASRGLRRDFIDLYAIMRFHGMRLPEVFSLLQRKFGQSRDTIYHTLQSLEYFKDADCDPVPLKLLQPIDWDQVKKFFTDEAQKTAKQLLEG